MNSHLIKLCTKDMEQRVQAVAWCSTDYNTYNTDWLESCLWTLNSPAAALAHRYLDSGAFAVVLKNQNGRTVSVLEMLWLSYCLHVAAVYIAGSARAYKRLWPGRKRNSLWSLALSLPCVSSQWLPRSSHLFEWWGTWLWGRLPVQRLCEDLCSSCKKRCCCHALTWLYCPKMKLLMSIALHKDNPEALWCEGYSKKGPELPRVYSKAYFKMRKLLQDVETAMSEIVPLLLRFCEPGPSLLQMEFWWILSGKAAV